MKEVVRDLSPCTALVSSVVALMLSKPIMNFVSTWPYGYVQPSTVARLCMELGFYSALILLFGISLGLLHGRAFGVIYARRIAVAATIPVFLFWVVMTTGTYGVGFFSLPILISFFWLVEHGVKVGSRLPQACALRESLHDLV